MPLTEKNLEYDGSVDFGMLMCEIDQDELLHSPIPPYSTLRAADLKRGTSPANKTLQEVLANWNKDLLEGSNDETNILVGDKDEALTDTGLQKYELLVQGFTVDDRITPGFRYRVRRVGESQYLFNGEAKRLESIGLGYGRRLTFSGDRLNFNDCFFWSDSSPSGFAFNVQALREGDVFTIVNSQSVPIGEITIESVDHPQVELETLIENGSVVKNVAVRFTNSVRYFSHHCNLVGILNSKEVDVLEGVAELVKPKGSKEAFVRCIKNVNFPKLGQCHLEAEP